MLDSAILLIAEAVVAGDSDVGFGCEGVDFVKFMGEFPESCLRRKTEK